MKKIAWIGPRESDIWGLKSIYSKSITYYGSDSEGNASYCARYNVRVTPHKEKI